METTVNTPFGPIVVSHPDDASEADILRFAELEATARQGRRDAIVAERPEEFDPSNEQFRERFGAADPSQLENFRAGFGKAFVDAPRGIAQAAVEGADLIPGVNPDETIRRLRENATLARERDADLMGTGAGFAGNIGGNIALVAGTGAVGGAAAQAANAPRVASAFSSFANPTTFRAAIGSGGLQGALAPVGEDESRAFNTTLGGAGGALGQGVSRLLSRVAQPITRSLSSSEGDAVELLAREGIQLDAAQRSGSQVAGSIRRALQDNPVTNPGQSNFVNRQMRQFTRAVLRTIGEDADEATPTIIRRATTRAGQAIDDAANTNPAVFDDILETDLASFVDRVIRETGDDGVIRALNQNVDDIFTAAVRGNGVIPGVRFSNIRSSLSNLSRQTPLARDLQDILFDALERAGGNADDVTNAVAAFRNVKIIDDAIDKRGAERLIFPRSLATVFGRKANAAVRNRGLGHPSTVHLSELARAGSSVLREPIGNSGTASRLLGEAALLGLGTGGGVALGADPQEALAIGAGTAALPLLLQRGLLSQGTLGRVLTQGTADPVRRLLQNPAVNLASTQGGIQTAIR